jgi:hypothetical protein
MFMDPVRPYIEDPQRQPSSEACRTGGQDDYISRTASRGIAF